MMKNNENKMSFKNDKVEHLLLYHFLNENHTQIVSIGCAKTWINVRTEAALALLYICVYSTEKINFTIKKPELNFSNIFNYGKNNHQWIVYWSLGKRKVLMGCQLFDL